MQFMRFLDIDFSSTELTTFQKTNVKWYLDADHQREGHSDDDQNHGNDCEENSNASLSWSGLVLNGS